MIVMSVLFISIQRYDTLEQDRQVKDVQIALPNRRKTTTEIYGYNRGYNSVRKDP